MTNTLATRKQSAAIRHRMAEIRSHLPHDVDAARARARQLTDWKYHMRRRPWPILAVTVVAAYLIVPAKRSAEQVVVHTSQTAPPAPKKGIVGGIAGALMAVVMKSAVSMATQHVSSMLSTSVSTPQSSSRSEYEVNA